MVKWYSDNIVKRYSGNVVTRHRFNIVKCYRFNMVKRYHFNVVKCFSRTRESEVALTTATNAIPYIYKRAKELHLELRLAAASTRRTELAATY